MTKIEALTQLGIIGAVRQRMGADSEKDMSRDDVINRMGADDLVKKWAGWHLGDESWWTTMKAYYDGIERLSN